MNVTASTFSTMNNFDVIGLVKCCILKWVHMSLILKENRICGQFLL